MLVNYLLFIVGGTISLLCAVALTLFPMHPKDVESQAAIWLGHIGLDTWGKGLTTTTDDWISTGLWVLLAVCIAVLLVAVVRIFRRGKGGTVKTTDLHELPKPNETVQNENNLSDFDIPIRDSINHIIETSAHTFNSSGGAERQAFRALHKEMCADRLSVIGMQGDFNAPERISASKCGELEPREVAVPPNPTSPNGVLFALIDLKEIEAAPLVERSDPLGFTGLRVRSVDLYRKWPKNQHSRSDSAQKEW